MGQKEDIEQLAQRVLRETGVMGQLPVDPVLLANKNGITVHNAQFSDDSLAGMISKKGSTIRILVSQTNSGPRKRFTIAHELGHHFLHLMQNDGDFVDPTQNLFREAPSAGRTRDYREAEANKFASALLMPAELVRREFSRTRNVGHLSKMFAVSEEAMTIRISELGLF